MKCLTVLFLLVIIYVEGDEHLNVNGPFGKHHVIGDEPSPHACSLRTTTSFSRTLSVMNINVSVAVYSSNELITITWMPISVLCVDDFVGIYFVDIPLSNGK
jgi:hypothetical protein